MKAYTDLEQSKKLAEILPIESADMHWQYIEEDNGQLQWFCFPKDFSINENESILAWSLAALFDLLPNNEHIDTTISRGGWKIDIVEYVPNTWWCEYEDDKNQTEFNTSEDNPVDACVNMILKLKEKNLL